MLCYGGKRGITTINYKKIFFILLRIDGNAGLRGGLLLYCRRYRGPALPAGVYYYFIYIYIGPTAHEQRGATKLLCFTFLFIYLTCTHIQGLPPTSKEARQSQAKGRRVLAAAHDMCTRFLDNKMALKGRGGKAREDGVVQGVLVLRDYYQGTDLISTYM